MGSRSQSSSSFAPWLNQAQDLSKPQDPDARQPSQGTAPMQYDPEYTDRSAPIDKDRFRPKGENKGPHLPHRLRGAGAIPVVSLARFIFRASARSEKKMTSLTHRRRLGPTNSVSCVVCRVSALALSHLDIPGRARRRSRWG
jgi:hypothetical protein